MLSSPLHLHLHLYCTAGGFVREMLDVWPPFPIEILSFDLGDNTIAALEHRDRICTFRVNLNLTCSQLERFTTVTREPFPALTSLHIWSEDGTLPVLPVTFSKGFAPRLRSLVLKRVPFQTIPQLVLSFNDLSELFLEAIPYIGYTSPEAMVTGLAALTKLRMLYINFEESFQFASDSSSQPNRTTFAHTDCPPRSHRVPVYGCQRVLGGSSGSDRFPSTRDLVHPLAAAPCRL